MKLIPIILLCICSVFKNHAQVTEPATSNGEQQLENITANNSDVGPEDDSWIQQMQQFIKDPVNLNTATETTLAAFHVLSPLQIRELLLYRKGCGNLISVYELQAVPGWDIAVIKKIRSFITVSDPAGIGTLLNRARKGEHSLLIRLSQNLERSKGYGQDSATNHYPGSPQKILLRYTYHFKHLVQWGLLAEKDAGEQFFKGAQKQGFDFYSAHFFLQDIGNIRALALGDFTVNLGQGLVQWQGLAFTKSADVTSIKREGAILRPYHSAGEINFHRGIGITLVKKNWQATAFVSLRKIDANFVTDTLHQQEAFVSSLQSSGYHRTKSETDDKGIQRQIAFGGNLSYRYKRLHLGLNAIHYKFKLAIQKPPEPYNKYGLSGQVFGNYSLDYSYTLKNLHLFGEFAVTNNLDMALLNGLIISVSSFADMSVLYRNISRSYNSLYTNAFTENTYPVNEQGLYTGITIRPNDAWRLDAYADVYEFPWLKYRVDAASRGADLLAQVTYKPNKQLEIYSRYHAGVKALNADPGAAALPPVVSQHSRNWRAQLSFRLNPAVMLRNRTEITWYGKSDPEAEQGFLTSFDVVYKPLLKPWSGNIRVQYVETGGYNSRLYAYENDVLYSFSIPVFYDKGFRYYINLNADINKKICTWIRWSQSIYPGKDVIGSGLDEIRGHVRSELRLQVLYKF